MYEQRYHHSKTSPYIQGNVAETTPSSWPNTRCSTPPSSSAQAAKASRRDQTQTTPRTSHAAVDTSAYQTSPGLKVAVPHETPGISPATGASTGLTPLASKLRLGGGAEFSNPIITQQNDASGHGSGVTLAYGSVSLPFEQQQQQQQYQRPQVLQHHYQQHQQQTSPSVFAEQAAAMGYVTGPLGAGVATLHGMNPSAAPPAEATSSFSPWNPSTWPSAYQQQQHNPTVHNAATNSTVQPQQQHQQQQYLPRPGHVTTRYTQPAVLQQPTSNRPDASWPYMPGFAVVEGTAGQQEQVVQTMPPMQQVVQRPNEQKKRQQQQQHPQPQQQPTHSYSLRSAAKAAAAAASKAASAVVSSTTNTLGQHKTAPKELASSPAATSPVTPIPQQNQAQEKEGSPPCRRGMNPATVLRSLGHVLTPYEKSEVLGYPEIWFVGQVATPKIRGSVHSGLPNAGYDDTRGDYQATPGDHIAYRYEIISLLGQGSFGQVLKCVDHGTGTAVALKIIRNKHRFQRQAQVEASILSTLSNADPTNQAGIVRVYNSFTFRNHLCITFELLGTNLYEHIKANNFVGMPLPSVRHIAVQVLNTLVYLRGFDIVHCDLKPENILLSSTTHPSNENRAGGRGGAAAAAASASSSVKVIDFGSSCYADQRVFTYIQSRFYRAPEVILGLAYGHPIDVWSLACVLAELVTGAPLFPGEHEAEQIACICEILGLPPLSLLRESPRGKLFFDLQTGAVLPIKPNSQGKVHRVGSQTLPGALNGRGDALFLDFLKRCLQWDPERRMTAYQALQHPWIAGMRNNSNSIASGSGVVSPQQEQQQQRLGPLGGAAAALRLWR
jgi:serine/threonine protein kinase